LEQGNIAAKRSNDRQKDFSTLRCGRRTKFVDPASSATTRKTSIPVHKACSVSSGKLLLHHQSVRSERAQVVSVTSRSTAEREEHERMHELGIAHTH